ncbi:hypothetical protein VPHK567_0091 [Vibrio phage K567]
MIIFEAFSRPVPYKWVRPSEIEFTVNGTKYRATYNITYRDGSSQMYIDFQWNDGGQWSYKLKKGGDPKDAMAVFATVLAAGEEKANQEKPDFITFSAFSDEDDADAHKRFRLYKRMADRYAKQLGYTMHVDGRNFILKNNNPSTVRRIPNDGIMIDDELTYVEMPRTNEFTWATMFECTRPGDFEMVRFKNGFATIKRQTEDKVEIMVKAGGQTYDNLDSPEVWDKLNGELFVTASWRPDEPQPMSEKASLLENGWMILTETSTVYKVENVADFEAIWGYKLESIR